MQYKKKYMRILAHLDMPCAVVTHNQKLSVPTHINIPIWDKYIIPYNRGNM